MLSEESLGTAQIQIHKVRVFCFLFDITIHKEGELW